MHDILDGEGPLAGQPIEGTPDARRLLRYKDALRMLESHREKAPDGFADRVMAALADTRHPKRNKWLRAMWPEGRLWALPSLAGALVALLVIAGVWLIREPMGKTLIQVRFELHAPSAKKVEIVGTFSNWMPGEIMLKGPDAVGYWNRMVMLPPGQYEYVFLVDGEKQVLDQRFEAHRPDGFGNKNSVLVLRPEMIAYTQDYPSGESPVIIPDREERSLSLPAESRGPWEVLLENGIQAGIDQKDLEAVFVRLTSAGISPDQASPLLAPVFRGGQPDILDNHLLAKLNEGILEGASFEKLTLVIKNRDHSLRRAGQLLTMSGMKHTLEKAPDLHISIALALESGQPPAYLKEVLAAGKDKRTIQIRVVIEAGESLHHAGLGSKPLKLIIIDCLEKDLTWPEIGRVVGHVKAKLKEGLDGMTIRKELWV